ncbi:hypothetical protein HBB16_06240 [Pseudonocardia sp. MCCB 268]|nr:hypothetical protein [Pseudonocardia cytotoxica]
MLTDCGTGLMHSAMYGVLGLWTRSSSCRRVDRRGLVAPGDALDWLDAHGYGNLVRNAVVVINSVYRRAGSGVRLQTGSRSTSRPPPGRRPGPARPAPEEARRST